jgi:thiamine-phosphate pyrophosphorylase
MSSRTGTPTNQARQRLSVAQRVAGLYVIIDPAAINGRDPSNVAEGALRGGATCIQLRDKIHDKGDQLAIARSLKALCENFNAIFIVNDHADLAVASVSHGLHLGQRDLPANEARFILRPHQIIGISNALLEEAKQSARIADYIAVGAIYPSPSKKKTRPAGLTTLRKVREHVSTVPIVAIGGITLNNVDEVLKAGADGICVIGAVCQADNPEVAARTLTQRISALQKKTYLGELQ